MTKVKCVAACGRGKEIRPGGTLRIKGSNLKTAVKVIFLGVSGKTDDIYVPVISTGERAVKAKIPADAISGPVKVQTASGGLSKASKALAIAPPPPIIDTPDLKPALGPRDTGAPVIETGTSNPRTVFVGARKLVSFAFRVNGEQPAGATINLIRLSDGATVKTWNPQVTVGQTATIAWDGTVNNVVQPNGRYAFRLSVQSSAGATAKSADAGESDRDAFDLYGYMFPIKGEHNYGQGGARFGAGRKGHRHQGQDVMAKCGTPLVAARGGKVLANQYHSAAGYYLVIDGANSGIDNAYMHLRRRSSLPVGSSVYTGQTIGEVGDTGDARGCHLHFEEWSAPGWYRGGKPFNPLADLTAWDVYS